MISRKKLYLFLSAGLLAGYILIISELILRKPGVDAIPDLCFFKTVTGLPCPSCGSTRSVLSLLAGNFSDAAKINPLGFIIAVIMLVTPFWLVWDVATGSSSLYRSYQKTESILRKPLVAAPLILLILANWVWNIAKGI